MAHSHHFRRNMLVVPPMLDELLPQIEQLRVKGAVVVLKWDGERTNNRCTVVITRQDTDYVWRKDSDDLHKTLLDALLEYRQHHSH